MVQGSTKLFLFQNVVEFVSSVYFFVFDAAPIVSHVKKLRKLTIQSETLPAFRLEEKKGRLKTKICFQTTFYMIPQYETLKQLPHFRFNIVGAHKKFRR